MNSKNSPSSLVKRLKDIALSQKRSPVSLKPAGLITMHCQGCGAPRAKQNGLTKCAYCGHVFLEVELDDGLTISKEDNSK